MFYWLRMKFTSATYLGAGQYHIAADARRVLIGESSRRAIRVIEDGFIKTSTSLPGSIGGIGVDEAGVIYAASYASEFQHDNNGAALYKVTLAEHELVAGQFGMAGNANGVGSNERFKHIANIF